MAAWRQQKAICDIDQQPECPLDRPAEGPCCMLPARPLTAEEEAADVEQKKLIDAEIAAMTAGVDPKGKGKKGSK